MGWPLLGFGEITALTLLWPIRYHGGNWIFDTGGFGQMDSGEHDRSRQPFRSLTQHVTQLYRPGDFALFGLLLLVGVVGLFTAFAVELFEETVATLFEGGFHLLPTWLGGWGVPTWLAFLLFPFSLGLLLAVVKRLVPKGDRHHAIPLVILSLTKRDGKIRPLSTLLKTLGAILTLGAGGSLGREGPVVLLGGGIGSALGQLFRLRADWIATLVAAGAAAAVATAFHAPITGAFFAMEIVLIQFSARSFALVALASTVAATVSRYLAGGPAFPIPAYQVDHPWAIGLFLGLGLVIAPISRLYIGVLYGAEGVGKRIRQIPDWLKPALGGILFGLVALAIPQTLGAGLPAIEDALYGRLSLAMLLTLLLAKLLTIGLTSGSGWMGGVFTPALFLGAMAGGAFGHLAGLLLPGFAPSPGAFAVVGMAAMIAGATQAPLTAIALIFEVTRDYRIALPALLACGIATLFSQRISPYSIDTLHLPELGILLPWQIQDLRTCRVGEVMATELHTVRSEMELKAVIAVMQRSRHGGYPVLDQQDRLVGLITLRDLREVPLERRLTTPVSAVMKRELVTLTPGQSLADGAMLMARHGIGRLPVVDPQEPSRLLGMISRSDILRAYPTAAEEGTEP